METLDTKALFFTTSPRTPAKMIPEIEIKLLNGKFSNRPWNKASQEQFIDELARFEDVKTMILRFRQDKENHKGTYKQCVDDAWTNTVLDTHRDRIACGKTKTRETHDASLKNFVKTQKRNLRDYTDACFRYLRYTGLVSIAHRSWTISIFDSKAVEVDYILSTVDRNPVFIDDTEKYKAHLFSAGAPLPPLFWNKNDPKAPYGGVSRAGNQLVRMRSPVQIWVAAPILSIESESFRGFLFYLYNLLDNFPYGKITSIQTNLEFCEAFCKFHVVYTTLTTAYGGCVYNILLALNVVFGCHICSCLPTHCLWQRNILCLVVHVAQYRSAKPYGCNVP